MSPQCLHDGAKKVAVLCYTRCSRPDVPANWCPVIGYPVVALKSSVFEWENHRKTIEKWWFTLW